jgi:hypothetical protein
MHEPPFNGSEKESTQKCPRVVLVDRGVEPSVGSRFHSQTLLSLHIWGKVNIDGTKIANCRHALLCKNK